MLEVFREVVRLIHHTPCHIQACHHIKAVHIMSYPSVPSHHRRPLVSVRSEGATAVRKNLEVRKFTGQTNPPGQQSTDPNKSHVVEDSSDESGGEDDVIVRIDSPSTLSFPQAP